MEGLNYFYALVINRSRELRKTMSKSRGFNDRQKPKRTLTNLQITKYYACIATSTDRSSFSGGSFYDIFSLSFDIISSSITAMSRQEGAYMRVYDKISQPTVPLLRFIP